MRKQRKLTEKDLGECRILAVRESDWNMLMFALAAHKVDFVELDKSKYHEHEEEMERVPCPKCGDGEFYDGRRCEHCGYVYGVTPIP